MICFFHSSDLDGHCSGAIVRHACRKLNMPTQMYGVNYGRDKFVEKTIEESGARLVYMVDFCLEPFDRMLELQKKVDLVWIDHHQTSIDALKQYNFKGIQQVGTGACALTWDYFYGVCSIRPWSVQRLAEHDVGDHTHHHTLPLQYGIRNYNTTPDDDATISLWKNILESDADTIKKILYEGKLIHQYEMQKRQRICNAYSFYTKLNGYSAVCCNIGLADSSVFDGIDPDTFDIMIAFCRLPLPRKKWNVSMYSKSGGVNVGAIALSYGGGGHENAAGFQCETLPFEI